MMPVAVLLAAVDEFDPNQHHQASNRHHRVMCTLLTLKMTLICYNKLRIHLTLI